MDKSRLNKKISRFPKMPGVYVFYGTSRNSLYVGKATSLRDRVRSYFSGRLESRPIATAIEQIRDIKIFQTDTVLEALIMEANLIKKLQPKYNAMGKDDKSFVYVVLTKEEFPRFIIARKTDLDAENKEQGTRNKEPKKIDINKTYGPYTSRKQIEIVLKLLRRIFPYHSSAQKTEKGCLDFELGRCPGPYAGAISRKDYLKNIRGIRMILEGKKKGLVKKLEKEMKEFSKREEFEKAADARNKLFALKHIHDVALISEQKTVNSEQDIRIEAYDISNISGEHAVGSMIVFAGGEPDKSQYRKFKIKTIQGADDVGMMKEVLSRRFNNNWSKPDLILLDGGMGQLGAGENVLRDFKLSIPLVAVTKGKDRKIFNYQFSRSNQFSMTEFSNEIIKNRNLVKSIMDEAHRFAIGYHRKVRKKSFLN